jgi:multiple sugar transport system substrate-binding protein
MNPPAQPVSAPVGPKPPAVPPMPGQPPAAPGSPVPQQPIRIQQPPQTLTALSSMASNRLPAGADVSGKPIIPDTPNKPSTANVTATPQAPQTAADPKFVQPKKSIMRYLPFIGGGILLLLILGFVAFSFLGLGGGTSSVGTSNTGSGSTATGGSGSATGGTSGGTTKPGTTGTGSTASGPKVTIEYWGLWEPTETMAAVIKDYETKNPNISIKYSKQSYQDYRVRLQNALNSENGPDIFRYHASWVPMLRQQLSAIPTSVMSPNDYQTTFYPVAVNQLQSNGQLVGIPLMYDGLALYYNTELFETAVVTPPKTWAELRTIASQLTLKSGSNVTRGGLAMGNSTNVEHFADVIALLILQNGGDLTKPDSAQVRDALLFYTNFINTDQVWSASLPSSTVAFSRGDAAMMIAPSWRAHEVKAMNPDLKFATTPLPQLSETRITWASYWAEGVSGKSSKKEESWKFLKYLSSKEVQQKLYADQAKARSFGELYSRKDLANELAGDPVTSAFMQDAPYAKGWQMSSFTHDDGANDQIIKYYEDAVTALNEGENIEDVQETLTQGVSQVLRQYGISSASTQ